MTIHTRIRTSQIGAGLRVNGDQLIGAAMPPGTERLEIVPSPLQLQPYLLRNPLLDGQHLRRRLSCRTHRPTMLPARRLDSLLRVHPEVNDIADHLQIALHLNIAARSAADKREG